MEKQPDTIDIALDALAKGIVAIPCHAGTKVPKVKWKEWQHMAPPVDLLREWFRDECNIAIVTSGMVVFDCEEMDRAAIVIGKCGETVHKLQTPRGGMHLGYRRRKGVALTNKVKVKGLPIDIRTDGGLEMIPPSRTKDGSYEWLGPGLRELSKLPVAKVAWTRERTRKRASAIVALSAGVPASKGPVPFPEQYCLRIKSVLGQNGSKALVRVVCVMRDAGRSPEDTFAFLFGVWNPTCAVPEWSEGEIRYAIRRHYGIASF